MRNLYKTLALTGVFALLMASMPSLAEPKLPKLTGRVVDNAGMLQASTRSQLTKTLAQHEQKTSNQIVVATVKDLQGYSIERFANELARKWQLGQKDKNNGVLLLVAKAERKVRIEVGYGLEGDLTDAISANIIHGVITPAFKRKQFDQGISQAVAAIMQAINGSYTMKKTNKKQNKASAAGVIIMLIIMALFSLIGGGGSGRGGRRRGMLYGAGMGAGLGGGFGSGGFGGGGGGFGGGGASGGW